MNNGWIKLHRSALNNDIRRFDPTAWHVFTTLLLLVDKNTGEWRCGTHQLANWCGSGWKQNTIYKATVRLEKAGMIERFSQNQFTTYHICKWDEYQSDSQNQVKTKSKPSHTRTRSKNKELRNIYIVETQSVYDLYIKKFHKNPNTYKLTDKRKQKIQARLKDAGIEMLIKAIVNTASSSFHTGDNDRGWHADLDFIVRSYEQVERLAGMDKQDITKLKPSEVEGDMEYVI